MKRTAVSTRRPRSLAEAIQRELRQRGWSQSRLARELETTEASVHNWMRGKYPSHPMYVRICLLFEWPLPYSGGRPNPGDVYLAIGGTPKYPAEPALAAL